MQSNSEESENDKTIEKEDGNMAKPRYIFAYDPIIKRRVVHMVKGGYAISMVTGHRFRYSG